MKKVLIDSSTWVSYFLGIKKNAPICQKVSSIIERADIVLIPDLVYAEVLNTLKKLKYPLTMMLEVKSFFDENKFFTYEHDYSFYFKKLEFYMDRVTLDTQDLIILASAFEQWPCELITGDKDLNQAYQSLKSSYETY